MDGLSQSKMMKRQYKVGLARFMVDLQKYGTVCLPVEVNDQFDFVIVNLNDTTYLVKVTDDATGCGCYCLI